MKSYIHYITAAVILLFSLTGLSAQQVGSSEVDYNLYYNYPFSVGVDYSTFNPFSDYGVDTFTYEFGAYK